MTLEVEGYDRVMDEVSFVWGFMKDKQVFHYDLIIRLIWITVQKI